MDFFTEERSKWVFKFDGWIVEELTIVQIELVDIVFNVVDVDDSWVAARNYHWSHEQINEWCKSFNILFACKMHFWPDSYLEILYGLFIF